MNKELIKESIYNLLKAVGEDPERDGLKDTPERVVKMYSEILSYPEINYTTFEDKYDDIVMVKNIEFCSMCEHHLLPFYGIAHVAYIPNGKIIGLSKIARIVEKYSRRLQVQERMTDDILNELKEKLGTDNLAIYVEAKHMCMIARGVKKELSATITTKLSGVFKNDRKNDFYFLLDKCNY
ncbi:MAG: GTP cyclohydrolase I FolE [Bacilli bacterium]|nr:GTP cyclohydrolase I FolE [Bacilli bacterium]